MSGGQNGLTAHIYFLQFKFEFKPKEALIYHVEKLQCIVEISLLIIH